VVGVEKLNMQSILFLLLETVKKENLLVLALALALVVDANYKDLLSSVLNAAIS
jgi:hypothetical protein